MAHPPVPQRPLRSQNIDMPAVPPRPKRLVDRSVTPDSDPYAPSPLNDPSFVPTANSAGSLSRSVSRDLPPRPPSVSLPSVGQEGSEYAHIHPDSEDDAGPVEQTKTIAGDLPLHAPKASLPLSTAKSRIQAVTRTDSNTAAAVGIGRPASEAGDRHYAGLTISRSSSSQQRSRPSSIVKADAGDVEEQGIPEIGMQIPLYPNAGDVQAPTPAPSAPPATGVGFFNKGDAPEKTLHHTRTKSGREVFNAPVGSYGMHGHGVVNHHDPLEKKWYQRHPEDLARETQGEYGPMIKLDRKEYNMTSAELNKLVHEPAVEVDDSANVGTPDEEIGYIASTEFASRIASTSPRPASAAKRRSVQYADSPLRQVVQDAGSDDEDPDVIHVDHPSARSEDGQALAESMDSDAFHAEAPILAADQVAKRPEAQYMTPAVELDPERHAPHGDTTPHGSRPHSRSNSIQHSAALPFLRAAASNDAAGTPLEDVKEYEPLFPDDERKKAPSHAESPDDDDQGPRHQFPSKDVWEDAPDSLLYQTTVEAEQLPQFSRPEAEHEPKEIFGDAAKSQPVREKAASDEAADKSRYNRDVRSEPPSRPAVRHRFPSKDTWEDAPSHHLHTAEVGPDEVPAPAAPQVPARPSRSRTASDDRPAAGERKSPPAVPGRPKPQVAAARSAEGQPLERSTSSGDDGPARPKAKPPVPARPAGSKIAALRGSFMTDLESRLQMGPKPVAPKPSADEAEAAAAAEAEAPLSDARKTRARGPARRRPGGTAASPAKKEAAGWQQPKVSFMTAVTVWEIDEDGNVSMGGGESVAPAAEEPAAAAKEEEGEAPAKAEESAPAKEEGTPKEEEPEAKGEQPVKESSFLTNDPAAQTAA